MRNLSLSDFSHINTVNSSGSWNTSGEAGDTRRYSHGRFRIFTKEKVLLSSKNVQWVQNISYPGPIGEAHEGTMSIGAYFVAEIQHLKSDEDWVHQLDPNSAGYVLGVLTAASFGPTSCFSSNSYWVSLRGLPNFSDDSYEGTAGTPVLDGEQGGSKVGIYQGSSERAIKTAQVMASTAKTAVIGVAGATVAGAVGGAVTAALVPGAVQGPPGQGLVRLLGTAAFVAKLNEIHGFHSDAMAKFGNGLKIFIGKVEWPFSGGLGVANETSSNSPEFTGNQTLLSGNGSDSFASMIRQETENREVSVSDELFGGCAFYTSLIVIGFLSLHAFIWLCTRKKPWQEQLVPHAWMIYLFSVVMSHVYRAAVLNSMQYMRSHVGAGTGKGGLYLVAVLQLLVIGIGFTAFFVGVMVLALRRVRRREVKWIPKNEIADPDMRQSALISGEYQAEENDSFHVLFECYYSSLAGPRLWLAALELGIIFLDAIFTALIWNEVVCLAILVSLYAILFGLFLLLAPFVDKVEGTLIVVLGLVEFVLLVMDFLGALGDYDSAEGMEFGSLVLGFVAIGLAVVIAVYCDLIPTISALWAAARRRFRRGRRADSTLEEQSSGDADSEWSELSRWNSGRVEPERRFDREQDHIFAPETTVAHGLSVTEDDSRGREEQEQTRPGGSSMIGEGGGQESAKGVGPRGSVL
ncbi:unnamed protein product [Chondrus crispus]|uniref:TRP C-terminal domain-containing protein n=1 Tax=Chondrus crispus TaxID=2769 RepID=R7QB93_CHOCR|nr:unnamed protein product [Chondrus crispus]CDF35787.1 unnamed protein product [Chondrus crispus]|eukprot:XP_005715606.1 unnamed protein product [Chondrus crispus]